jgi:predicted transcriptional regulator
MKNSELEILVFQLIAKDPSTIAEIGEKIGKTTKNTNYYIKKLKEKGVIHKVGKLYYITPFHRDIMDLKILGG